MKQTTIIYNQIKDNKDKIMSYDEVCTFFLDIFLSLLLLTGF